jgi:miniconductance mechanosensitive channel
VYAFSNLAGGREPLVKDITLFLIIVVSADFVMALLSGLNAIYKQRPTYTGASVAAYIDVIKVLVVIAAIVLSLSFFTDTPPVTLLSGVGAWLAVLLLIFRDTILNFLASIQISSQQLVKDGDWIEVPGYDANGTVIDITLNAIKVRNFDNTVTVIPTYKMVEVAYRNWRSMEESGGRRIKTSITLDVTSVRFCDLPLLTKLGKHTLIAELVAEHVSRIEEHKLADAEQVGSPLDGPKVTNVELFMRYIEAYLKTRRDVRQRRFPFVVRVIQPSPEGLPIEVYVFTRQTSWAEFEAIQGDILVHLMAAAPYFELRLVQQPTSMDFSRLMQS